MKIISLENSHISFIISLENSHRSFDWFEHKRNQFPISIIYYSYNLYNNFLLYNNHSSNIFLTLFFFILDF